MSTRLTTLWTILGGGRHQLRNLTISGLARIAQLRNRSVVFCPSSGFAHHQSCDDGDGVLTLSGGRPILAGGEGQTAAMVGLLRFAIRLSGRVSDFGKVRTYQVRICYANWPNRFYFFTIDE